MGSASTKPSGPEKGASEQGKATSNSKTSPLRIILADSQAIYRVGVRKIFALEDDIRVVAQAETLGQTLAALSRFAADVVLYEAALSPNPGEALVEVTKRSPHTRIVVLAEDLDEQRTVEYLRRGVRGIITRSIPPDLLIKCVRKVADGETWLDNRGVNAVIEAYRAQAAQLTSQKPKSTLSEKELLIISFVAQGLKNKEIATEIGTTEQVIKNYLRKIYDKLGVSDRLELALYCIHHQLLKMDTPQVQAASAGAASAPSSSAAVSKS